jgi:tRNA threonylcarbamoyl adenosine modification protein YeaZ
MKTILAVDSTSEVLSISLSEDINILSQIKDDKSIKHMVNIINDIDYVLKKAHKTIKEVQLFALNLGPGDFTGGRIGISVLKIFSLLSGNPVLGFNSLDVFSVGCMLKNIDNISKKISDYDKFYIIPAMDVKNSEIYSGIYEVGRAAKGGKVIFSVNFEDKKYFLNKIFGEFLIKSDDYIEKISQTINQVNLLDKCSCPSCKQLFEGRRNDLDKNFGKTHVDSSSLEQKKFYFVLTANAVKTYKDLFDNLKIEILSNHKENEIILDEENIYPSSENINFLANYSSSFPLKSLPVAPVYVRDFIAFSRK